MVPTVKSIGRLAALLVFGIAAWFAGARPSRGQARLSEADQQLAITWLLKNCEVGEQGRLARQIRERAEIFEPMFLDAAEKGPDPKLIEETERAAGSLYERNQERLKSPRPLGLSEQDVAAAASVTREQFVTAERANFLLRYRSQAVAGLGLTGGVKARALLQKLARDAKSPLRNSAAEALKQLAPPKPPAKPPKA
jgi:hypothetical protein